MRGIARHCEGGDFSYRKVPSLAVPPEKTVGWGMYWGERPLL